MISAEERLQKELQYLMALTVVRKLYADGKLTRKESERLNHKNAEVLGREEVPL